MKLRWRLFVNAKNETKARLLVDRFQKCISEKEVIKVDLSILEIEPYWKDKTHYKVEAETDIGACNLPNGLLRATSLCNRVADSWHLTGPHQHSDGWDFELTADSRHESVKVPGLSTIFCSARNVKG